MGSLFFGSLFISFRSSVFVRMKCGSKIYGCRFFTEQYYFHCGFASLAIFGAIVDPDIVVPSAPTPPYGVKELSMVGKNYLVLRSIAADGSSIVLFTVQQRMHTSRLVAMGRLRSSYFYVILYVSAFSSGRKFVGGAGRGRTLQDIADMMHSHMRHFLFIILEISLSEIGVVPTRGW
jgi:hypothetical protein